MKSRPRQPLLFQAVGAALIPARLADGAPYAHDYFGPTSDYVDCITGWPWDRKGGDWLDADGVRHGPNPWFTITTERQGAAPQVLDYSADVTALVQRCQRSRRWLAIMLQSNAGRTLAGRNSFALDVTYKDGKTETIPAWCVAALSSSDIPNTTADSYSVPCLLEFKRPSKTIAAATLRVKVTHHWSGNDTDIRGYLVDPPLNKARIKYGTGKGVIGRHDYVDGAALSDFMHAEPLNFNDERNFDPAIWGGDSDLTKLPHRGAGKWILGNERANWSLVTSAHDGEGFKPLAPKLGAIRLRMPARPIVDGSIVGSSGDHGANGMIYLPEPLFGRLGRLFVRYYFRLGTPYAPKMADRKQVRHQVGGQPVWTTGAGKWGIAPDHSTGWGGVSGTSGGPYGWQMRGSWYDCDAEQGGPDEGGIAVGHHLFDYGDNNPADHRYGKEHTMRERWGQRGGLGGLLYAGHWYCIETEIKLNTYLDNSPGFKPDGELRTYVDGKLAYERKGMVFRSGPVYRPPRKDGQIRPCRELGVRGIWLDWFHGGKTLNTVDRTAFYTALVYGTEYIGPMRGAKQ